MGKQAFCIHGHFYQPPREDPLTGEIPIEVGAMPFRNWNERIDRQCYKPNADLGNFEHISFNVGPTLADWLAVEDPATLKKIIQADRSNVKKYGVGNAIAQANNHVILPLANRLDKITQIRWGIHNFEHYFGRKPAGMWLPETAVDLETLDVLAENGIEFTILAPWQAQTGRLDASLPYYVKLPGGKQIVVFFYHQDLSMRISFDPGATINADVFLREKLMPAFKPVLKGSDEPQLALIASDGELYGHHQPFRDKFLAYLVDGAVKKSPLQVTYPALWLQQHPPQKEIKIRENTSWSCFHGVARWSEMCDCTPHAKWKKPFRRALNEIAGMVDSLYRLALEPYINDPWELRHGYGNVLCGEMPVRDYINAFALREITEEVYQRIRLMLAAQYERQRMFTSCGWFFDDFDRIEPRNNVAYAAQSVWLVNLALGIDLSQQALAALHNVKSWRSGLRADRVFSQHLKRAFESQGAAARLQAVSPSSQPEAD